MRGLQTLNNGMRLYLDPMPDLESAALGVWIGAGAMDETTEESGVAHLLEHMAFKGTKRRSARDIVEEIESVGGYMNAATGYQRTGYYARVLKGDVERAIDILADILLNPALDDEELRKEQEVVVQEIGEAWDAPDDAVFDLLQGVCFRDQAIGRPILGSVESVRGHDRARLLSFIGRNYAPGNMILVASGGIDPEKVAGWAGDRFAAAAGRARPPARPQPRYVGGVGEDRRDIEQAHFAAAFPGVGARNDDFYATRILAEALGGGMASRLFQSVREKHGLAYSVYAYADCYDEAGLVGVYAGCDPVRAVDAASLVRREIEELAGSLSQTEVDRARAMLKSTLLMGLESPMGRIESAAAQYFSFGEVFTPDAVRARLDAVTTDDVKRCARRMLEAGPGSVAVVGPIDVGPIAAALGAGTKRDGTKRDGATL